jgi:hypothetical protein
MAEIAASKLSLHIGAGGSLLDLTIRVCGLLVKGFPTV